MKSKTPVHEGDLVTVRQVTEKTVTAVRNADGYDNTGCFTSTDKEVFHIADVCYLKDIPHWEIVKIEKPLADWPPQENDVWETEMYTMHFVNRTFHFKNVYSDSTTDYTVEQVKDMKPKLLFRVNKKG